MLSQPTTELYLNCISLHGIALPLQHFRTVRKLDPHHQDIGIGSMPSMCTEFCSSHHHFLNHPYIYTNKNITLQLCPYSLNTPQHLEGGTPIRKRLYLLISTDRNIPPGKGTQKGSRKINFVFFKIWWYSCPIPVNPGAKIWTQFLLHQN